MAEGTGSLIRPVGSASTSRHPAPSRRSTLKLTCNPPLHPTLAPSLPRWPRVWRGRSRAKGYRIGRRKTWSQLPPGKSRDRKVTNPQLARSQLRLNRSLSPPAMSRKGIVKPSSKSRVYLPDVTGLTSALESPARVRLDYHLVNPADREIQSQCLSTTIVCKILTRLLRTHREHLEHCAI